MESAILLLILVTFARRDTKRRDSIASKYVINIAKNALTKTVMKDVPNVNLDTIYIKQHVMLPALLGPLLMKLLVSVIPAAEIVLPV